jgi:hypothetical protein
MVRRALVGWFVSSVVWIAGCGDDGASTATGSAAGGGDTVGCQLKTTRRGTVQLEAPVGHSGTAACADILHDLAHRVGDARLGAAAGARQGLDTGGGVEGAPVEAFHHIIFSIGRTRMAEAPAALSRSSVSQKTAS